MIFLGVHAGEYGTSSSRTYTGANPFRPCMKAKGSEIEHLLYGEPLQID